MTKFNLWYIHNYKNNSSEVLLCSVINTLSNLNIIEDEFTHEDMLVVADSYCTLSYDLNSLNTRTNRLDK